MTTIRIPPLAADGAAGGTIDSRVVVRLVDARGRAMIGVRTTDGVPVTCYAALDIPAAGDPWELDLTPQSAIARADAAASYYAITILAAHRTETFRVQVPDSAEVLELADLVAGSVVEPADITAGRLLPAPASEPDGRWLTTLDGAWVATDAPSAAVGWDDLRAPATVIPLQGQSGDPDRDTDGSLLFDAAAVEQIAILLQMPHTWTGTGVRPHLHWSKSSDAAGDVIWEMRHRAWHAGQVPPAWSAWSVPAGRSEPVASDQRELVDYWAEIAMDGHGASAMLSLQIRRAATNVADTYAADARLWEADVHYQAVGSGTVTGVPA